MHLKISIAALFIATCTYLGANAQDNSSQSFPSAVPPSPDAAGLGKYGQIPVGTYTGIPDISIPLYTVSARNVELPISVSYHASGNKVEDVASNMGLGWTLNAGGVITRSIAGRPDDSQFGYFDNDNDLPATMTNLSSAQLKAVAQNSLDALPDEYSFNFGNYSGKIIFDRDGTHVYTIPAYKFKIKPAIGPTNGNSDSWEITTEEGIQYTFAARERSTTHSICGSFSLPSDGYNTLTYTSSWFLSRIQAPQPDNFIELTYWPVSFSNDVKGTMTHNYRLDAGGTTINTCTTIVSFASQRIDEIRFPEGKIKFSAGGRLDLPGSQRITAMSILDGAGDEVRKYTFSNGQYFESGCGTAKCKRLKLNSITESGRNSAALPPYQFEYNTERLPPRDSHDFDHWGYYNKRNNTHGYPEFIDYNNELEIDYLPGDDRRPVAEAAQAGVLTKIIYPTGGYTTFEYEINETISDFLPNKTNPKYSLRIDGNSSNPNTQSGNFTISGHFREGQYVWVRYQNAGCSTSEIPSIEANCPAVFIKGVSTPSFEAFFQHGLVQRVKVWLSNGTYKLVGKRAYSGQTYFLEVEIEPEIDSPMKWAGGLRVRKITDFDGISETGLNIRKYDYNVGGLTTGRITNHPIYTYRYTRRADGGGLVTCQPQSYFVRCQDSNVTLGSTRGSYVGYGRVTELHGEFGENGKTEYDYTSVYKSEVEGTSTWTDLWLHALPWGPAIEDKDWMRGLPTNVTVFRRQGANYLKVKETTTQYKTLGTTIQISGLKVFMQSDQGNCDDAFKTSPVIKRLVNQSIVPEYTLEKMYNPDGVTYMETRTDFTYSPVHRQVTESVVTFEPGTAQSWTRTIKIKYPSDYGIGAGTLTGMAKALSEMKNTLNIQNVPIEKQVWETRFGANRLISAEINFFKESGYEPDRKEQLIGGGTITTGSYTPSLVSGSSFVYDNTKFRRQLTYDLLDETTGNVLEATGLDGVKKSYLWGYQNSKPIAEVLNAPNSAIAFTSFEEPHGGNWLLGEGTFAGGMAGATSYSGSLHSVTLPAGKYVVSFWAHGTGAGNVTVNGIDVAATGTGWNPHSTEVSLPTAGQIAISTNGVFIDELRAYPEDSRMTSLTYESLVGVKSTTDHYNYPHSYNYDNNGRLQVIFDHRGQVIKRHTYKVKGYTGPYVDNGVESDFTVSGNREPGVALVFSAVNTNVNATYNWSFGDGTVAGNAGRTTTHAYTNAGIYEIKLTVVENGLSNYSIVLISVAAPPPGPPTWPAPTVTATVQSGLLLSVTLDATATASPTIGEAPFKYYLWSVFTPGGTKLYPPPNPFNDPLGTAERQTTTNTTSITLSIPLFFRPSCTPYLTHNYVVKCRVVDANDVASQLGSSATVSYTPQIDIEVSPTSVNISGGQVVPFEVFGATGAISVSGSAGWISITSITQCSGFEATFGSNTTGATRTGRITVHAPNGDVIIHVLQHRDDL